MLILVQKKKCFQYKETFINFLTTQKLEIKDLEEQKEQVHHEKLTFPSMESLNLINETQFNKFSQVKAPFYILDLVMF